MTIFQKSVLKRHLDNLDKERVEKAHQKFRENYNPAKIEEIKKLKEEEYQDGFLRDIFVDVFGYTLKPDSNYNLAREFKNQGDGKKADGAILKNNKAVAVIELKSTKTKDLKSITEQAFNYKNNQPECKYVITSNFQKLRFYIDYAHEYEEFDLFNLQKNDFELLYLLLHTNSIFSGLPLKLKEETKFHEQEVSDKLYKDYSIFKSRLFENLIKNNPDNDKLTLFNKSQKLLDRFLFILFAEDSGLLPPNSISRIIDTFHKLTELDAYKPIYDIYKQYFGYMNIGRKGKTNADDIPAYNGGLFYTDELLDNLKIDDKILIDDLLKLSEYDFNTEVDVNILGHIFEHSLSEIEEITAEINVGENAGEHAPPHISKRKKDGVFYTPKYITQYIVENTIGTLCNEKRKELDIEEIEFDGSYRKKVNKAKEHAPLLSPSLTAKGKKLYQKLNDYKDWLLSLKIVDPACGSGAFLNQALNFLIAEHKNIDDIIAELTNTSLRLFDTDKAILENNLYGVDINEESVEIAKLSLWLRTAQKGRRLSNLNDNIKCGNSLIDDPAVAGKKAFDWNKEFPQIFRKKEKKAWHITTATHNSRYSQRMFDNHVKRGEPVWLSEEELIVTEKIAEIVKEDRLNILAYNICGDHMHLVLVCEKDEVPKIMQKIKSMSARTCNIAMGRTIPADTNSVTNAQYHAAAEEHAPLHEAVAHTGEHAPRQSRGTTQTHLWTQTSGKKEVVSEQQLSNTINYIHTNRQKHELPENKKLEKIISEICCSVEHAFQTEYTGGFDVVIGNPPYVHLEKIKETSRALKNANYETYHSQGDIYCVFVEKGVDILKPKGLISYIMPNKWLQAGYGKPLREYFLKFRMTELIDFGDIQIFDGATTYPCIFTSQKAKPQELISISVLEKSNTMDFRFNIKETAELFETKSFSGDTWVITSKKEQAFLENLQNKYTRLSDFVGGQSFRGVLTGLTEAFVIDEEAKQIIISNNSSAEKIIKPVLRGRDIIPWFGKANDCYLVGTFPALNIEIENYPSIKDYLLSFGKERLEQSGNKGSRKKTNNKWFETQDTIAYHQEFVKPKIMYQVFQVKPCFIYDEYELFCNNSIWFIPTEDKALLGVLNSKMGWWLITKYCTQIQNGYQLIWKYFGQIPIPEFNSQELTELVEKMLEITQSQQAIISTFIKYLNSQLSIIKLSKKLENWHELEFSDFIKELNKAIKKSGGEKLSKSDEMDWMEVFETKKAEAQTLKAEIDKTDKEIDKMVYELYGLTEDEIKIVEEGV